jgi:riboflavin synthase
MGIVRSRDDAATSTRLVIDDRGWEHRPELGDSIAINGCCLTLTGRDEGLAFDMVPTTLQRTTLGHLAPGDRVNLEHAATPSTLLGGHLVQGHVEGVGTIQSNGDEASEGWKMKIQPPAEVAPFLVDRGSVTVEGVSLTIAGWNGSVLSLALIPETLQRTTLGGLLAGDKVNLEPDCLAKMVAAMLEQRGLIPPGSGVPGS